jgi:hypothetical protein
VSIVELSCREAEFAVAEGGRRRLRRIYGQAKRDYYRPHTLGEFDSDIQAVAAEMAFSRFISLPWFPSDGPQPSHVGDVGTWEVRWTHHDDGHLLVYGRTPDTRRVALVTGTLPSFFIRGWILAGVAKRSEWSRSFAEPTYFVPQAALSAFDAEAVAA